MSQFDLSIADPARRKREESAEPSAEAQASVLSTFAASMPTIGGCTTHAARQAFSGRRSDYSKPKRLLRAVCIRARGSRSSSDLGIWAAKQNEALLAVLDARGQLLACWTAKERLHGGAPIAGFELVA